MKKFEMPEIELEKFMVQDVISTSGGNWWEDLDQNTGENQGNKT